MCNHEDGGYVDLKGAILEAFIQKIFGFEGDPSLRVDATITISVKDSDLHEEINIGKHGFKIFLITSQCDASP